MSEPGGPTTQSGIYYQNSIAALYLGRLVDPGKANNQRIESVRVEAPEIVDDIVVTYSNGYKEYIQAKESVNPASDAWKCLWCSFKKQASICQESGSSYSLILVVSKPSEPILSLLETCERANGKDNSKEWWESLSTKHQKKLSEILVNV